MEETYASEIENYETESIKVPELNKYAVDTDVRTYESAVETWRRARDARHLLRVARHPPGGLPCQCVCDHQGPAHISRMRSCCALGNERNHAS